MRILIAAILSAALLYLAPSPVNIKNSAQPTASNQVRALEQKTQQTRAADLNTKQVEPAAVKTEVAAKASTEPKPEGTTEIAKPVVPTPPSDDREALLQAAGVPSSEWSAVKYIFHKESTWRPTATNHIGCIGLGQNCPDKKGKTWLTDSCPNWQSDPVCQIKRFSHYATERYGGWWQAHAFWLEHGWW